MAKEVLQTNDEFLSKRTVPQTVAAANHNHYSVAFLPISPIWRELRKICQTQLFSHKTLDASQDVRRKKVQQLRSEIHQSSQLGEAVYIGTAVSKTTFNILSNSIFSIDLFQSTGAATEFKDVFTDTLKLVGAPNLADFFPVLRMIDPQGLKRRQTKNIRKVLDIIDGLVNQRLKMREGTNYESHNDMLDVMLNISQENKMIDKTMIEHVFYVFPIYP
ncbi:Cytochrome P450 [Sesbania bispinosa]|nr:Cytochrome P450 [Sesbania bispinosa]